MEGISVPSTVSTEWEEVKRKLGFESDDKFFKHVLGVVRDLPKDSDSRDAEPKKPSVKLKAKAPKPLKRCKYCKSSRHASSKCCRTCFQCKKSIVFKTSSRLAEHDKQVHQVKKCAHCGENITGQISLDRHIKEQHAAMAGGKKPRVNYKILNEDGSEVMSMKEFSVILENIKPEPGSGDDEEMYPETGDDNLEEAGEIQFKLQLKQEADEAEATEAAGSFDELTECDVEGGECKYCNSGDHTSKSCKTCTKCEPNVTFRVPAMLRKHFEVHHKVFTCLDCHQEIIGHGKFLRHKHSHHATKKPAGKLPIDFVCATCGSKFKRYKSLARHELKCVGAASKVPKAFTCDQCELSYKNQSTLEMHVRRKHSEVAQLHTCVECGATFPTMRTMFRHKLKMHRAPGVEGHAGEDGVCGYCGSSDHISCMCKTCLMCEPNITFRVPAMLRRHFEVHHKTYKCTECGTQIVGNRAFIRHADTHVPAEVKEKLKEESMPRQRVMCTVCGETFTSMHFLALHEIKYHGAAPAFPCQLCDVQCASSGSLRAHHRNIHAVKPARPGKVSTCEECAETFTDRRRLFEHKLKMHRPFDNLHCSKCNKTFADALKLYNHTKFCHKKKSEGFPCSECGRTFQSSVGRKIHLDNHHRGIRYQCTYVQCGKMYTTKHSLLMHISANHELATSREAIPHLCSLCGKGFRTKPQLNRHVSLHASAPRRSCPHCSKLLSTEAGLRAHIEVKHNNIRKYDCNICPKSYGTQRHLIRHYQKCHENAYHYLLIT